MTRKIFLCLIYGFSAFVVYGAVVEVQSFSSAPAIAGTVESGTIAVDVGPEVPAGVSGYRLLLNRESSGGVVYGVEFDATEVRPRISGLWQSKTNNEGDREDINFIRKSNYLLVPPELPLIWHGQGTPDDTSDDDAVDTLYSLSSIEVSDGGSGYTEPPAVTISGSGGPSLTATAVLAEALQSARVVDGDLRRAAGKSQDSQGQITDVVLQGAGCYDPYISEPYDYETPLTVGFSDPPEGGVRAEGVVRFLSHGGGAGPVIQVHFHNEESEQNPRGTGYAVAPTIEIYDEGSGWDAVATAVVNSDGSIAADATIEAGGYCYASVRDRDLGDVVADHPSYIPKARLVGGDGIGAAVDFVDVDTSVAASILGVTITNPGSGYVDPPTVTFSVGDWGLEVLGGVAGKHATAMAIVDGNYPTTETEPDPVPTEGRVTHVELVSPGCYDIGSNAPTLTFSEPQMAGGVRAEATINFAYGAGPITEVKIIPQGSGYTTPPVIQLYNEGVGYAAQARATAKSNGKLRRRAQLHDNNSFDNGSTGDCYADYDKFGYSDYSDFTDEGPTFLPRARLVGGNGSGAGIGRVGVEGTRRMAVLSVDITTPGSGYTEPPTITFSGADIDLSGEPNPASGIHAAATAYLDGDLPENVDPAEVEVTVDPLSLELDEGASGTYSIVLSEAPSETVVISAVVDPLSDVVVDPPSVTFTTTDWYIPQTLTVTANPDDDTEPDPATEIAHVPSGGGYGNVDVPPLTVTIIELDEPVIVTGAVASIVLATEDVGTLYTECPQVTIGAPDDPNETTATATAVCATHFESYSLDEVGSADYNIELQALTAYGWTTRTGAFATAHYGGPHNREPGRTWKVGEQGSGGAKSMYSENVGAPYVYWLDDASDEHWFVLENRSSGNHQAPRVIRVHSGALSWGGTTPDLNVEIWQSPVDLGDRAEVLDGFEFGQWQLLEDSLAIEWDDRFSDYYARVTIADGAASDRQSGYYEFSYELRPEHVPHLEATTEEVLANDDHLWGAIVPVGGGKVEGYFEANYYDWPFGFVDRDPFFFHVPEGDDFDAVVWMESDHEDGFNGTWGSIAIRKDGPPEENEDAYHQFLVNDVSFDPRNPNTTLLRYRLRAGETYKLSMWSSWPPTRYDLHVHEVEEPGSDTANAVDLSITDNSQRVRGGNISTVDDVDYFRLVLDQETNVVIRAWGGDQDPTARVNQDLNGEAELIVHGDLRNSDGSLYDTYVGRDRFTEQFRGQFASHAADGFTIFETLSAGRYYVQVRGDGSTIGPYTIAVDRHERYPDFYKDCTGTQATGVRDYLWDCQFGLKNREFPGEDINVEPVWSSHDGSGVKVLVADTGMDITHEDLRDNILVDRNKSYGFPGAQIEMKSPRGYSHGTTVAGVIAARDNEIGIRGIAPRANLISYNVLQFPSDDNIVSALTQGYDDIAVANHSWGSWKSLYAVATTTSAMNGLTHSLNNSYFVDGSPLGTVHVKAAGNEYYEQAYSTLEEFHSHYGWVVVCAVSDQGTKAWFSEHGSVLWVCAPSEREESMNFKDWATPKRPEDGIEQFNERYATPSTNSFNTYSNFSGTSVATPHVSGVAALIRDANPNLTWRDVKMILAATARVNDPIIADERSRWWTHYGYTVPVRDKANPETGAPWVTWSDAGRKFGRLGTDSGSHYRFSHRYGFGVVDAQAAVELAQVWPGLPEFVEAQYRSEDPAIRINDLGRTHTDVDGVKSTDRGSSTVVASADQVDFIEWLTVEAEFNSDNFRDLRVILRSPSGTESLLSHPFDECWDAYGDAGSPHSKYHDPRGDYGPGGNEDRLDDPSQAGCQAVPGGTSVHNRTLSLGSARHLGESPCNQIESPNAPCEWTLIVSDEEEYGQHTELNAWSMMFYGHQSEDDDNTAIDPPNGGPGDEDEGESDDGDDSDGDDTDDDGSTDSDGMSGTCVADDTTLCLQNNRFKANVWFYTTQNGWPQRAQLAGWTQGSGVFYLPGVSAFLEDPFVDTDNLSVVVKLLDGCDMTGGMWFTTAGSVRYGYVVDLVDTVSGELITAENPWAQMSNAHVDLGAFPEACASSAGFPAKAGARKAKPQGVAMAATAGSAGVSLHDDKFTVTASYRMGAAISGGATGDADRSTKNSALFRFMGDESFDLLVNVVNHCAMSKRYRVVIAGATIDDFNITITHNESGKRREYTRSGELAVWEDRDGFMDPRSGFLNGTRVEGLCSN